MEQKSQMKVVQAGFTIIRKDDTYGPRIKYKDRNQHEWKTLQQFETKAERDRRFNYLLRNVSYIED